MRSGGEKWQDPEKKKINERIGMALEYYNLDENLLAVKR
jgi:hypothetical protein